MISRDLVVLNNESAEFNIKDIGNRRFMYCPQTGTLILGFELCGRDMSKSHAVEHMLSNVEEPFDVFVRGWVGYGKGYRNGIIHFAPHVPSRSRMFDAAYYTLQMFAKHGATGKTIVRGFGEKWERPVYEVLGKGEAE